VINLWGDRDVEWTFITAYMPQGPGEALDFGSGGSSLAFLAARRGYRVVALDLESHTYLWRHPQVEFVQGDLLKLDWEPERFDLIINCSTVEHVGLVGRFSVTEDRPDGDLEAMAKLNALMKHNAVMLLTIPVGQDAVFVPVHRVYGKERLPRLLDGYEIVFEEFWIKENDNRWVLSDRDTALAFKAYAYSHQDPSYNAYALGCFVLRNP
jgi:SAM-dependent methyltransferase